MKIAIIYDRVNKWGGAERVLLALQKIFPDAELFTSVYDSNKAQWAKEFKKINTSFLQRFEFAKSHHEILAPFMPIAFETLDLSEFEFVISVTSEAAKGVITSPKTKHVCICLTPTRYLWSGYDEYFATPFKKFISRPMIWYLKKWDVVAASRPDKYIAISKTVQNRIKKYYDRDSVVVYPAASEFKIIDNALDERLKKQKYFLVVSRLSRMTPYKRVDLAIDAANTLGFNLKIVGQGKGLDYYKKQAGKTVEFVGSPSDGELCAYYKNAQALIFPGVEDFGLVMVEAQLLGTPVIALRKGGAEEIIREDRTGEFFDEQSLESLTTVLKSFDRSRYNTNDCIENGRRFSFDQFKKGIEKVVSSI